MLTNEEMELAQLIAEYYDEDEYSYPYYDRRVYVDMNGVISSQGQETDILFVVYTINRESDRKYLQLFISSPDDMYQDFVYFTDLTDEEREAIVPELKEQILGRRQLSYAELAELDDEFDNAFKVDENCEDDWSDEGLGTNARLAYIEDRRIGRISGPEEFDCPARFRK